MIVIDKTKALELLDAAVAKRGADTVVEQCHYVVGGEPNCIVGEALALAGVDTDLLYPFNSCKIGTAALLAHLKLDGGVEMDRAAVLIFGHAQDKQDNHWAWGEAVEETRDAATGW